MMSVVGEYSSDANALLSPESLRKKKNHFLHHLHHNRGGEHHLVVVPQPASSPSSTTVGSPVSPPTPQSAPRLLFQQLQKPLKKFSLASAFPPKSSAKASNDCAGGGSTSNLLLGNGTSDSRKCGANNQLLSLSQHQDECQERKYSSPLDYRDSGVYLGETRNDPVLDMLNMRKQSPNLVAMRNSGSGEEVTSPSSVSSSAPPMSSTSSPPSTARSIDGGAASSAPDRRIRKSAHPPALSAMDSSKSLPSSMEDAGDHRRRANNGRRTCSASVGETSVPSLSSLVDEDEEEEDGEEEECEEEEEEFEDDTVDEVDDEEEEVEQQPTSAIPQVPDAPPRRHHSTSRVIPTHRNQRQQHNSNDDLRTTTIKLRPPSFGPTKKISLGAMMFRQSAAECAEGLSSRAVSLFVGTPSPFSFRKNRHASSSTGTNNVIGSNTDRSDPQSPTAPPPFPNRQARASSRASFFRRSRSLTSREANGTKSRQKITQQSRQSSDQQQQQQQQQHILHPQRSQPQLLQRGGSGGDQSSIDQLHQRHRTGSTGEEESATQRSASTRVDRQRKISQPAMVRFQIENDSIGGSQFDDRKTSVVKKKRSFADPIAKKLSFLRRRPTDSSLCSPNNSDGGGTTTPGGSISNHAQGQSPLSPNQSVVALNALVAIPSSNKHPPKEEVRKWATSFDDLLAHSYGAMLFRLFLQREFSEENIDFWMACEEYKKLRDLTVLPTTANKIYNDFVAVQAPKEVNLDSVTRSITAAGCQSPTKSTFEQAQHRIQSLMEKDSYPRFLRSDLYLELVKKG